MSEISLDEIGRIFDESWNELIDEFDSEEWTPLSERDLQLYLAHKLINRLSEVGKTDWVRIEFPIPLDPSKLEQDFLYYGMVKREKGKIVIPDITIIDISKFPPRIYLIAEVKCFIPYLFTSRVVGLFLEKMKKKIDREALEGFLRALKEDENQYMAQADQYIDKISKDLDKISSLIRAYRKAWDIEILGYMCVIDLIYGGKPDFWDRISSIREDKYPDVRLYYAPRDLYGALRAVVEDHLRRKP